MRRAASSVTARWVRALGARAIWPDGRGRLRPKVRCARAFICVRSCRMRFRRAALAAAISVCTAAAPAHAAPATATLASGGSAFWEGPTVAGAQVGDPSLCDIAGPCFSYTLDVTAQHAKVLRVAIDSIDASNDWMLELVDPAGRTVASDESYQEAGLGERNDIELFANAP